MRPQGPAQNNQSWVTWNYEIPGGSFDAIALYRDGAVRLLTDDGYGAMPNDAGRIIFGRQEIGGSQLWMSDNDVLTQLTDEPEFNGPAAVDRRGSIVWTHRGFPDPFGEVRAFMRYSAGDMNCDGYVSAADISPFVAALLGNPLDSDSSQRCDDLQADMTGDGVVSTADIGPFIQLLVAR